MTDLKQYNVCLREPRISDKIRLAELCNNKKIWDNLRDLIPYPYTEKDAEDFILLCQNENPRLTFAIEYMGEFAGCIGLVRQTDIYRLSAEIGYWIGEPYWGKGIATAAVKFLVDYGFNVLGLIRIYSGVFEYNAASQKVLEKAGFQLDCILKNSVIKNGRIFNEYRYGIVKDINT